MSLRQFSILTKYYLLTKKRTWKTSIWEIITPIIFGLILGLITKAAIGPGDLSPVTLLNVYSTLYFEYIIFLTIIFASGCVAILGAMVVDKEIKMKETLKIMSMKKAPYAFHYFFGQGIATLISSAAVTIILGLFLEKIEVGSFWELFFCLLLLGLGLNSLAMTMSTFFGDHRLSTQVGPLLLFLPSSIVIYCIASDAGPNLQWGYFIPQFPFAVVLLHWFTPEIVSKVILKGVEVKYAWMA
mmetsp:Transcript_69592/g.96655  ORF Transcript_69592/g.96655 Transcript_69592/m.96655 type:complete len:242 (+) Transcript_69592:60-785(+)|eukprot:CAMPEP_0176388002 /NCGR_PEP_ID=MMETSP0126-20121128/37217_1 /TAXON_ID=141414 ORGANISM="Strombidinopsis acuminatum, Strain SPMC142" /NCGR_SAMPLE_ID=MMETSP0126 /ASSEMBLY_ACC=CAM_ASM_000229 /LENGTH=241 /DNA_ID=CAMNT_0017755933 /DNA_START=148 /DNA_END=873 /DNA_ORIENTATION=-